MALAVAFVCGGLAGCGAATTTRPTAPVPERPAAGVPQVTGAPAPAEAPINSASMRGTVIADATRTPLARARVLLASPALSASRVTITAPDGWFAFQQLPPGTYSVTVTRTGYVPGQFGERRSAPPEPIAVTSGQAVTGIEVSLQPAGVIAGQILDEDDMPFAGALVDALVSRTVDGRSTFVSVASAQTDDRGEFRLVGLPAGQFYVSAFDSAFTRVGDNTGPLQYSPTYFPGVVFAEQATRVSVTPGAEPQRVVFKLHILRPAHVAGNIKTHDGRQLVSGAVIMRPVYTEGLASVPSQDVVILPDASFAFRNVPPGQYQIRARGDVDEQGPSRFATFRVRVEGHDIDSVEMTLVPGARIEGRLIVDTAGASKSQPALAGARVNAPFADGSAFGESLTGEVQADGSYAIRGVMIGSHVITIEGLPSPWVLKSVTWRGQDITDTGVEADNREIISDVRVTITDAASQIAGLVQDSRGTAVADATVLIIPVSPQFWTRTSRRFRLLRSDADGRYTVRGLPAGEYRAVASLEIDDSEAYRRDLLQQLAEAGLTVSLKDLASLRVDLALTSLARLPRVPSR